MKWLRINSDARRRPRRRVATGLERGRRPAAGAHNSGATREEVGPPAGHRGDPEHATGAGPVRRGPAPARRPGGLRGRQGRRRSACPHARAARLACRRVAERGRPPGHGLIFTRTRTTRHYRPADSHPGTMPGEPASPAVSSTAGLDGPRSALGATATRTLRSPSQGWTRLVAGVPTQGRLTIPRSTRPRPPGGSRLRPGATACRNTPAAQLGRGRDSPPAARPRAAASHPWSSRPRALAGRNHPGLGATATRLTPVAQSGSWRPAGGGSMPAARSLGLAGPRSGGTATRTT